MSAPARPLTSDALALSSGTLATLTGLPSLPDLDAIQTAFVLYCDAQPDQARAWMAVWPVFWAQWCQAQQVEALTLETLAQALDQAGAQTQATLTRERLEVETKTRLRPTKPQAEPIGLFAQTQGALL